MANKRERFRNVIEWMRYDRSWYTEQSVTGSRMFRLEYVQKSTVNIMSIANNNNQKIPTGKGEGRARRDRMVHTWTTFVNIESRTTHFTGSVECVVTRDNKGWEKKWESEEGKRENFREGGYLGTKDSKKLSIIKDRENRKRKRSQRSSSFLVL